MTQGDAALRAEIVDVDVGDEDALSMLESYVNRLHDDGRQVLRCGLVALGSTKARIEVCTTAAGTQERSPYTSRTPGLDQTSIALVIPTGAGASIGGFIGDGGPVAQAFEAASDLTILHPNVVNGADLYGAGGKALYVDGFTLDEFFWGRSCLGAPVAKRVGLILDRMSNEQRTLLINAANACCAVWGIDLIGYAECREPTRGTVRRSNIDHFLGELHNPFVLYEAAERLVAHGAQAIAVVTAIEGIPSEVWSSHYRGQSVNPVGAIEALISRAITWRTGVPCAHAPAYVDAMASADDVIDPRAAAEVISRTGLPCVLRGLANASSVASDGVGIQDLTAIVVPFECAGGVPAIAARNYGIPLVAVRSNKCVVGVHADRLGLKTMLPVENYAEAIAYVVTRKARISWRSIKGPLGLLPKL
jgi:hypothetical protein